MQAIDILPLVKARIDTSGQFSRSYAAWHAAFDLWTEEYATWRALADLGHDSAARCAWQRRSAASDLCTILTALL